MNIFVLNTGRCGSTAFIKACKHISNYSAAHESRTGFVGEKHFQYPDNHIEADNRLSWFLGRLEKSYGDNAVYVHLKRNNEITARSFVKRYDWGIIKAYRTDILMWDQRETDPLVISQDYCNTVNSNIELFLKDKSKTMNFSLENAKEDFCKFWSLIGAEGNLEAALLEFDIKHNASERPTQIKAKPLYARLFFKTGRAIKKFPSFIKNA